MARFPHILTWISGFFVVLVVLGGGACTRREASGPSSSERRAFLAGGSGEESGESNFFVDDLKEYRQSLLGRGWSVQSAVGGRDGLLPGSVSATNEHILEGIDKAIAGAKPGGEVLIVLHSHGREREEAWGQGSHSVVSEDIDSTGLDPGLDLDELQPKLAAAKEKNVRVALVDLSCYSAATQKLAGPACTVTLAASKYVSLCSGRPDEKLFVSHFLKLPPPGVQVSLEQQYFVARRWDRRSINLPQISSRLGGPFAKLATVEKGLSSLLVATDPLDVFEDLHELRAPSISPFKIAELASPLEKLPPEMERSFRDRIKHMVEVRRALDAMIPALASDYRDATLAVKLPGRAELRMSPGHLSEMLDRDAEAGYSSAQVSLLRAMKPHQSELERVHAASLHRFRERNAAFEAARRELEDSAESMIEMERDAYDVWSGERPEGAAKPRTACSDFAL
jgi:hypothetical protein